MQVFDWMKSFQPVPGQSVSWYAIVPTTYITPHLGANPTYMATPLLAFNQLTLTLAGAVTHSPPPILTRADEDVEVKIDSFVFFRDFQLCQFLQGKFHQTDDSRQ